MTEYYARKFRQKLILERIVMAQKTETMRQPNIELLRIVAMLMIITLHYLDKGGILVPFTQTQTIAQKLPWVLEAFCMVSVNVYVLISGYFLTESKFRFKKVILIWAQVLFYSYVIGAIMWSLHLVPDALKNFYDLIFVFLPVTASQYWFATVYLLLFLIFPFLNVGIRHMTKSQHGAFVVVLTVILSLWKSLIPMTVPITNHSGMDLAWFVLLYFVAAYIRKYPEVIKRKRMVYLAVYVVCMLLSFGYAVLMTFIENRFGKLGGYSNNLYGYNSITMLLGAVCLFVFFLKWDLKLPLWMSKLIVGLGSCTFGVFLIHEHKFMRYYWPSLFKVHSMADSPLLYLHWLGTILAVFFICAGIEKIRQLLFSLITNRKFFKRFMDAFAPIEDRMNGVK